MKATELFYSKEVNGSGFVEIVIRQVPEPVPPSEHPYKYRLVYVEEGKRMVGYDNERGKGEHIPCLVTVCRFIHRLAGSAAALRIAYVVRPHRAIRALHRIPPDAAKSANRDEVRYKHLGDREELYRFVNPQQLMADFMADVKGAGK